MKLKRSYVLITILAVFALLITPACGIFDTGREVVSENTNLYDNGMAMVRGAQTGTADYFLIVNMCDKKLTSIEKTTTDYYDAVNVNTEAWTGHFRDEQAKLAEQLALYNDAISNGKIDSTKLDLSKLVEGNAMPAGLASGLALYMEATVQAPPPEVDSQVTRDFMAIQSECFDSMIYAGVTANDKINQYNTWISQAEGILVDKISTAVGFPLPEELPLIVE